MTAPPGGPVVPRSAVSVIPLRDGARGLEAFVQHRQTTMDFAAGAVVFPGGRCEPEDRAKGAELRLPPGLLDEHVDAWRGVDVLGGTAEDQARTLLATGRRELGEETGLWADPSRLLPWDRWVTPERSPKRFDVAFFVLPVPAEDAAQPGHTTTEATHSRWEPVEEVLAAAAAGVLALLTPTRVMLEELATLRDVATVVGHRPVISGVLEDLPETRPRPRR